MPPYHTPEMPYSFQLHRINPILHSPAACSATAALRQTPTTSPRQICPVPPEIAGLSPDDDLRRLHTHVVASNQCCSAAVQTIAEAPVDVVWSVVRRFDRPQAYKQFVRSCRVVVGEGGVGTLREVRVVSGIPAAWSTERLEVLDEEARVMSFRVVDGDHRLINYRSVTTLHAAAPSGTVVVESYAVDVPPGNTTEETCAFVDTIVKCNLHSLAQIAQNLANDDKKVDEQK